MDAVRLARPHLGVEAVLIEHAQEVTRRVEKLNLDQWLSPPPTPAMGAARRTRPRLGVVEAVPGEHAQEVTRRVEKLNLDQWLSPSPTPAVEAVLGEHPQVEQLSLNWLRSARALEGVEGLHVVVLLGRSSLLVVVLVLYTGVLFCYTLLVRSLVYVLGEELLLLWWLRCCCSCWP